MWTDYLPSPIRSLLDWLWDRPYRAVILSALISVMVLALFFTQPATCFGQSC